MKKINKVMATVLGVSMLGACAFTTLTACSPTDEGAKTYVSLDINPSVELVLDKKDRVLSVTAANEDGQVLLYQEEGIVGLEVDEAVDRITKLAEELGYLSEDNKVVDVTVSSTLGDKREGKIEDAIRAQCDVTSESFAFSLTVSTEGAYSLVRALEKVKVAYPDNKDVQKLGVAEYRLILSAQESDPALTVEAAVKMDDKELMEAVAAAKAQVKEIATEAYTVAVREAERVYDKAVAFAMDSVYSAYYAKNLLKHPVNYGVLYQMYGTAAEGFNFIADSVEYAATLANTPMSEEQVAKIVTALNLSEEEAAKLKNADGNVTVDSVLAYADVKFKNSEAGAALENVKKELNAALSEAETAIAAKLQEVGEKYKEEIEVIVEQAEALGAGLKALVTLLPESVKTYLNEFSATMETLKGLLESGITVANLREVAVTFNAKKVEIENVIKSDLTEEELAEVEEVRAEVESALTEAKSTMEQAIATAEAEAKAYLAKVKAERKAQNAA